MGLGNLDVFHHPVLDRILTGIKRKNGEAEKRERLPITREILIKLLSRLDQTKEKGANLHAAYCLAFAGFLRAGEFTYTTQDVLDSSFDQWHLTRKSIRFEADHLQLSLPVSKTDPFRRGITLTIAATNDVACALASLTNLYRRFPSSPAAPLFKNGQSFTRDYITTAMKSTLRNLGYIGNFSGHSFRRGAATTARRAGLTEDEIQMLGRWKSDAYKLYIQTHPTYLLNASKRLQTLPTEPHNPVTRS